MVRHTAVSTSRNGIMRTVRVSLASALVLGMLAAYPLMAGRQSIELALSKTHIGGRAAVVRGSLETAGGRPVEDAIVKITHKGRRGRVVDGIARTNDEGRFREELHEREGWHRLRIQLDETSDSERVSKSIYLERGVRLDVEARLRSGALSFMPIFHY